MNTFIERCNELTNYICEDMTEDSWKECENDEVVMLIKLCNKIISIQYPFIHDIRGNTVYILHKEIQRCNVHSKDVMNLVHSLFNAWIKWSGFKY
jgi:hypothetical protein